MNFSCRNEAAIGVKVGTSASEVAAVDLLFPSPSIRIQPQPRPKAEEEGMLVTQYKYSIHCFGETKSIFRG